MTAAPYRLRIELSCDADRATGVWRPTGGELGPSRPVARLPPFLVLEAMVQCAGELLRNRGGDGWWVLGGLDDAELAPVGPDVQVALTCEVLHRRPGSAAVAARAVIDGRPTARARLLMVARPS